MDTEGPGPQGAPPGEPEKPEEPQADKPLEISEETPSTSQAKRYPPTPGTKRGSRQPEGAALASGTRSSLTSTRDKFLYVETPLKPDSFPVKVRQIFKAEVYAAAAAVKTGIYVGWRCPDYHWDCFRLGDESKCFCGHLLKEHKSYTGTSVKVPCAVKACRCLAYAFIASFPEEVGEYWLRKRANFDEKAWRAKCKCKHTHEEHRPTGLRPCQAKDCRCQMFESAFLCAACDKKWEAHQTYFETTEMRRKANLPFGEDYMPFAEMPKLQKIVMPDKYPAKSKNKSLTGGS